MANLSPWLFLAGAFCCVLAAAHSSLGEWLIFRHWRDAPPIPRSHAGIIRASWHALSLLGLAMGVILWRVPLDTPSAALLSASFFLSAGMIAVWTRFRHAGWILMALIGLLVLAARF